MKLDRFPPNRIKAGDWHVNDVNVFLDGVQVVGDGVRSPLMWTEAFAGLCGWMRRYSCTARIVDDIVQIAGTVKIEWKAAYKKKLLQEDLDERIKKIVMDCEALGWEATVVQRDIAKGGWVVPSDLRNKLWKYLNQFPRENYRDTFGLDPLVGDLLRGIELCTELNKQIEVNFSTDIVAPNPARVFPFGFTEESQNVYKTPLEKKVENFFVYNPERDISWTDSVFTATPMRDIKTATPKVDPTNTAEKNSAWTVQDEGMVEAMKKSGIANTAYGYTMRFDGHMYHVEGPFKGAYDKKTDYRYLDVFRTQQGEFRIMLKTPSGHIKDRRLHLTCLAEKDITDYASRFALSEVEIKMLNAAVDHQQKVNRRYEGIIHRLTGALVSIKSIGITAGARFVRGRLEEHIAHLKQIARDALENKDNRI